MSKTPYEQGESAAQRDYLVALECKITGQKIGRFCLSDYHQMGETEKASQWIEGYRAEWARINGTVLPHPDMYAPKKPHSLKQEAISQIEALWPPDSGYDDTRAIGRELLLEALCNTWRELPEKVLVQLADLNMAKERSHGE